MDCGSGGTWSTIPSSDSTPLVGFTQQPVDKSRWPGGIYSGIALPLGYVAGDSLAGTAEFENEDLTQRNVKACAGNWIGRTKWDCGNKGFTSHQCEEHGHHNRNLKKVNTHFLTNDHKDCMDIDYDMFLVIEGVHFAGLAIPHEEWSAWLTGF